MLATTTPSLIFLRNLFEYIQQQNPMINSFGFGPTYNVDVLPKLFPILWVEFVESGALRTVDSAARITVFTYTFNIYCLDKIKKGNENFNDTSSDTLYNLQTFITYLDQDPFVNSLYINILGDVKFDILYEVFDQNTNGWVARITLKVPNKFNPCNIPTNTNVRLRGVGYDIIEDTLIVYP